MLGPKRIEAEYTSLQACFPDTTFNVSTMLLRSQENFLAAMLMLPAQAQGCDRADPSA